MNKYSILFIVSFLLFFSCKEQEARRPKQYSTNNFYKELIGKNKVLNAQEKQFIESFISKDTTRVYKTSTLGFWYYYIKKDTLNSYTPKENDLVTIKYNVTDINNNIIYKEQQMDYKVDKQDFIPGLQDGIKLMKKGEIITFVIPSYRAYGVTGDEIKIKGNQPIKSTITLINIIKQKENESK